MAAWWLVEGADTLTAPSVLGNLLRSFTAGAPQSRPKPLLQTRAGSGKGLTATRRHPHLIAAEASAAPAILLSGRWLSLRRPVRQWLRAPAAWPRPAPRDRRSSGCRRCIRHPARG